MKKTKTQKVKSTHAKNVAEPDVPATDISLDEEILAEDQFAVANRADDATSSGHRVEPIEEDDEHNAEKLVEEGLHGYLRAVPKKPHSPR